MNGNDSVTGSNDLDFLIRNINNKKFMENIPGIVFISLLIIIGIPGNTISLIVYLRKYKPSTYRTFIVCLAIVDLATCCTSMPFFIVILRYPIIFPNVEVCKVFHVLTHALCMGSGLILITIAADRYRKICVPKGIQLSERISRYICILDLLAGCFLSWPVAVMYGNRTYETGVDYINGTECTVADDFIHTKYPAYFNIFILFVNFVALITLVILYTLIRKKIMGMKKTRFGMNQAQSSHDYIFKTQTTQFSSSGSLRQEDPNKKTVDRNIRDCVEAITLALPEGNKCGDYLDRRETDHSSFELDTDERRNKNRLHKTILVTRVLFIITVVYFCSFLPHFALRITALLDKTFLPNLSFAGTAAYQTFRWSFFINNIANPVIYGFCDRRFMEEIREFCRSLSGSSVSKK